MPLVIIPPETMPVFEFSELILVHETSHSTMIDRIFS